MEERRHQKDCGLSMKLAESFTQHWFIEVSGTHKALV